MHRPARFILPALTLAAGAALLNDRADRPSVGVASAHQTIAAPPASPQTARPAARDAVFAYGCPSNATLTLAGTALVDDGRRIALVRTPTTSRLVREGQTVAGHTVQAIARRKVAVLKGAERTCLRRRPATSTDGAATRTRPSEVRATGPGQFAIDRAWLRSRLDNLKALSKDVRVTPLRKGGKLQGFRVARVRAKGVFAALGLRQGDVLLAANGQPLDSPNRILKLYAQLPDSDVVRLRVRRGGAVQMLDYTIE